MAGCCSGYVWCIEVSRKLEGRSKVICSCQMQEHEQLYQGGAGFSVLSSAYDLSFGRYLSSMPSVPFSNLLMTMKLIGRHSFGLARAIVQHRRAS